MRIELASSLVLAGVLAVTSACSAMPTPSPVASASPPSPSTQTLAFDDVIFPHHDIGPGEPGWSGLEIGSVELDGDCLFIVSDVGSGRYVALWPPQYRLVQVKPVAITPGDGTAPLVEGTHVRFGGGELDSIEQADILAGLLDGAAPPECGSTKYWVVMGYELP